MRGELLNFELWKRSGENECETQRSACIMSTRLYIAKAPPFSALEAYVADFIAPNAFPQALKSKCRELARADATILVSPTADSLNAPFGATPQLSLWLVAKNGYMKANSKLMTKLQQLELKLSHRVAISHSILQACYQFTLTSRLAPKWNQVSNWIIKGCEFLVTGKAQALNLDVGITGSEITLTLLVQKLSLSLLKPADLEVTTTALNNFKTDPHFTIKETSIYSNRCLLLPNFTVGYIFSASHQVPTSPEFSTYDKLRLHWKKQHGIILPERQDLFYQVFFKSNPGNRFSYPGCCVYRNHPLVFPSRDTDAVASAFVADLHARMPSLCGEPIRFSSKALTPLAHLQAATSYGAHSNTKPAATHSSWKGLAIGQTLHQLQNYKPIPLASKATTYRATSHQGPNTPQPVPSFNSNQFSQGPHTVPTLHPQATNAVNTPIQVAGRNGTQPSTANSRVVPTFKPTKSSTSAPQPLQRQHNTQNSQAQKKDVPMVPTFNPKAPSQSSGQKATASKVPKPANKHPSAAQQAKRQPPPPTTGPPPHKRPCLAPTPASKQTPPVTANSAMNTQTHLSLPPNSARIEQQIVPDLSQLPSLQGSTVTDSTMSFTGPATSLMAEKPPSSKQPKKPPNKGEPKPSKKAEPLQVEGVSEDIMKKILKTKAALLKKWLQENGVKCKSKDKKEDLAKMAALHIKETGKTFELASQTPSYHS